MEEGRKENRGGGGGILGRGGGGEVGDWWLSSQTSLGMEGSKRVEQEKEEHVGRY